MDTAITPFESKFAPILENISKHSLESKMKSATHSMMVNMTFYIQENNQLSHRQDQRTENRLQSTFRAMQLDYRASKLRKEVTLWLAPLDSSGFKQSSRAEGSRQLPLDTSQAGISELDRED
jgi:hypothetical protein